MSLDFLQGPGREFVESRAMERNGSGVSQILQWRFENGIEITDGLYERVLHNYGGFNHHHSEPVTSPVHHLSLERSPPVATGFLSLPGTGLRRVAIRVRGVAAKIPIGTRDHTEGQAQHNRYGKAFRVSIGTQSQIGGHTAIASVSYLPDIPGSPPPVLYLQARPNVVGFTSASIGLNTYEDATLDGDSDKAFKMDRIIYFSVNGAAGIQQSDSPGWLRHKAGGDGGVFQGGMSDASGELGGPLGTFLNGHITRNEDGLNLTSLKPPHGLMFTNPINSVGLDVKIVGYHSDTQMRPVVYRELKAL